MESGEAEVVSLDELDDGISFGTWGYVCLDTYHSIEGGSAGLVDVSIAFGYLIDQFVAEITLAKYEGIHAEVGDGVVCHNHEGGYIVVDTTSTLDKTPFADLTLLMYQGGGGENRVVADLHRSCYLDRIAYHHRVADHRVVSHMALCHHKGVIADHGLAIFIDASIDDHMLADRIVIADHHVRFFTFPAEILWGGCYDTTLVELVVLADSGSCKDRHMGVDHTTITDFNVTIDISKCTNSDVISDFCLRMYEG